jgi:putative ABC transport system substrate-binding protein
VDAAAKHFNVNVQKLDVLSPKDIATAFRSAAKEQADVVIWLVAGGFAITQRTEIVELAAKNRLPVIYDRGEFVEDGGLMTYSVSATDLHRRAATFVDKILKGAKPADLPVEQPTKFEFIVNLKAAKQIGLTIPPNVLARANKVIR